MSEPQNPEEGKRADLADQSNNKGQKDEDSNIRHTKQEHSTKQQGSAQNGMFSSPIIEIPDLSEADTSGESGQSPQGFVFGGSEGSKQEMQRDGSQNNENDRQQSASERGMMSEKGMINEKGIISEKGMISEEVQTLNKKVLPESGTKRGHRRQQQGQQIQQMQKAEPRAADTTSSGLGISVASQNAQVQHTQYAMQPQLNEICIPDETDEESLPTPTQETAQRPMHDHQVDSGDTNPYGEQPMGFWLGAENGGGGYKMGGETGKRNTGMAESGSRRGPPAYTLNIMVRQFTKEAERKLNMCLNTVPVDQEPNVVELLAEGIDATFDRTIAALGYIARQSRRRVTDAVMHWRRGKSELKEMARTILERDISAYRQAQGESGASRDENGKDGACGSKGTENVPKEGRKKTAELLEKVQKAERTYRQAERQLSVSTFILWRVLIEVVRQSGKPSSESAEDKSLEEIMYKQLRNMDPYEVSGSLIESVNWSLLAELVGEMSEHSFLSVSDRFIGDLERFPTGYTSGSAVSEATLCLLIHAMRCLRLSNTSLERFEETADFLKSMAKFFYRCENDSVCLAYCEVLGQLVLRLAGNLTAEVNHPTWIDATRTIYAKAYKLAQRGPEQPFSRPATTLVVAVLCVSPRDTFLGRWLDLTHTLVARLRPKLPAQDKYTIVACIARLLWSYLFRYSDTLNAKTRNMQNVATELFSGGISANSTHQHTYHRRHDWFAGADASVLLAAAQILRAMAFSQLNFTLENIFLPLLKSSFDGASLETMRPDRVQLCLRAYACIMWDHQHSSRPFFPTDEIVQSCMDPLDFCNAATGSAGQVFKPTSSNAAVHLEVSGIFQNLLAMLHREVGCTILETAPTRRSSSVEDSPTSPIAASSPLQGGSPSSIPDATFASADSSSQSSQSSGSGLKQRLCSLSIFHTQKKAPLAEIFAVAISVVTWCADVGDASSYRRLVELLVKNVVHADASIAAYCVDALKLLVVKRHPGVVTGSFSSVAFMLDERTASYVSHGYLCSDNYVRLVEVYLEVLQSWQESLLASPDEDGAVVDAEPAAAMYDVNRGFVQQAPHFTRQLDSLELKNIANTVDEVEGNGLFFFFSHDSRLRYLGAEILRTVTQFDDSIYALTEKAVPGAAPGSNPGLQLLPDKSDPKPSHTRTPSKFAADFGTRAIQVIGKMDFFSFIAAKRALLSEAERKRCARLQRLGRKAIVLRIAESPHGVDAALWFKIFDSVLEQLAQKCVIQIAIVRSLSCIRLVQLYDSIVRLGSGRPVGSANALVWEYMLYLKVACSSLTSTGDQRLHVPSSSTALPPKNAKLRALQAVKRSNSLLVGRAFSAAAAGAGKPSQLLTVQHQKITSARSVFRITIPLLTTSNVKLREALVEGLSCLNVNIFRSFVQEVDLALNGNADPSSSLASSSAQVVSARIWDSGPRKAALASAPPSSDSSTSLASKQHSAKYSHSHSRSLSPAVSPITVATPLATEICCILNKVISRFGRKNQQFADDWILSRLQALLLDVQAQLLSPSAQHSFKFQRLRRYFCGLLECLHRELVKSADVERWLPYSFRKRAFMFMMEWSGYGPSISLFQNRYSTMAHAAGSSVTMIASLELQKHQLQYSAISCMTELCSSSAMDSAYNVDTDGKSRPKSGKQVKPDTFDFDATLSWSDALFKTHNERIRCLASTAVIDLLTHTPSKVLAGHVVRRCYGNDPCACDYFVALNGALQAENHSSALASCPPYRMLSLALFACGSDSYVVRSAAASMVETLEQRFYHSDGCIRYVDGVCCRSRIIYKRTLFELSTYFANAHPEEKYMVISELTMLFHLVDSVPRRDIIAVLLPWIQTVNLNISRSTNDDDPNSNGGDNVSDSHTYAEPSDESYASLMVLYNFIEITLKYSHLIQNEVEALWVALASKPATSITEKRAELTSGNGQIPSADETASGARQIFDFLVETFLKLHSLPFIECARQIVVSLSGIPGFDAVNVLLSRLEPKAMVPAHRIKTTSKSQKHQSSTSPVFVHIPDKIFPYVADLQALLRVPEGTPSAPAFSPGELYTIFLADLACTPNKAVQDKLPLLLHLCFVLLDHQLVLIQDQACSLLILLIHQYGSRDSPEAKEIVKMLRSPDSKFHLWSYTDDGMPTLSSRTSSKNTVSSPRIPDSMDSMVRSVLDVFRPVAPEIQKQWSRIAVDWATTCKVMHIASRSFQVFRSLISFIDTRILRGMLSCLSKTISDESKGIQSFSMQILMTLNAITAELPSSQLIDYPQLFWCTVASLSTVHEHEFIEVLSTLSKFLSKIDLDSDETVQCLISTFPPHWEGRFEGLQKILLTGLRSGTAGTPSLALLRRLDLLKDSQIVGSGPERLLLSLLANLPVLLHSQTIGKFSAETVHSAEVIVAMADRNNLPGLARIIRSLVHKRFRNKEDFLSQTVSALKAHFFPTYSAETLVFLLGLLFNSTPWVKTEVMSLLKHVFRAIDLSSDEFVGLGADLVAPLLRLLMTDYVDDALEVLDEASAISASPFDKHYLMMSAGDSTMRKEYEKIATLFGIPDESGWSVPMPAVSTARTRNNIHAVYLACKRESKIEGKPVESSEAVSQAQMTPEAGVSPELPNVITPEPDMGEFDASDVESDLPLEPSVSVPSSYVQYNPLTPEIQQQLNEQQLFSANDELSVNNGSVTGNYGAGNGDTDSLSNMLATLENLDSFFTRDTLGFADSEAQIDKTGGGNSHNAVTKGAQSAFKVVRNSIGSVASERNNSNLGKTNTTMRGNRDTSYTMGMNPRNSRGNRASRGIGSTLFGTPNQSLQKGESDGLFGFDSLILGRSHRKSPNAGTNRLGDLGTPPLRLGTPRSPYRASRFGRHSRRSAQ